MDREDETAAARAERLELEVGTATRRLAEVERARATSARAIVDLESQLGQARADRDLWMFRLLAPLLGLERGVRWIAEKAGRLTGMIGRQVVFRSRRER